MRIRGTRLIDRGEEHCDNGGPKRKEWSVCIILVGLPRSMWLDLAHEVLGRTLVTMG